MSSQYCPICNALVLPNDDQCNICGTEVSSADYQDRLRSEHLEQRTQGDRHILWGMGLIFAGGVGTILSYILADAGLPYALLSVLVVYGVYRFLRGFIHASTGFRVAGIATVIFTGGLCYFIVFSEAQPFSTNYLNSNARAVLGVCVNSEADEVNCDSSKAKYTVLENQDLSGEESYSSFATYSRESHKRKCPLASTSTLYPSEDRWNAGDRNLLCVRAISQGKSDYTQKYLQSEILVGNCVNEGGYGVRCDSPSARYDVIYSHYLTDIELYPSDDFGSFWRECPRETDSTFYPSRDIWSWGGRNFICVKSR